MIHLTPQVIGFWCDKLIMIVAGIWCVWWGPAFCDKNVKSGRISQQQAEAKVKLFRICGWCLIVCAVALILIARQE
jgi:hypothetical protein